MFFFRLRKVIARTHLSGNCISFGYTTQLSRQTKEARKRIEGENWKQSERRRQKHRHNFFGNDF